MLKHSSFFSSSLIISAKYATNVVISDYSLIQI